VPVWLLAPWFALSVAAGDGFTCALARGGTVQCWGGNSTAELGDGTTQGHAAPVEVKGVRGATAVDAGSHACAVARGELWCWGGDFWVGEHTRARKVAGAGRVSAAFVGTDYTCVIGAGGHVRCSGHGEDGRITEGMASSGGAEAPVEVAALDRPVRQIAAGTFHACALDTTGRVACWGSNAWAHIVPSDEKQVSGARLIDGLDGVTQLTAGENHSCALSWGEVWCWGDNLAGQLGDGTRAPHARPARVEGLPPIASIAAGGFTTCALAGDGAAYCWGDNSAGALGSPGGDAASPRRVSGLKDARSISCGRAHCCAVTSRGKVRCWGSNQLGQLGIDRAGGETARFDSPMDVIQR
jgi:alpha-tubulin suppressor-like RCC1 family protein